MNKSFLAQWRNNFLTGLVIVLPAVVSISVLLWFYGSLTNITDKLLFFLPVFLHPKWIYVNGQTDPMFWHWRFLAFLLAIGLICAIGVATRNYFGKKMIEWVCKDWPMFARDLPSRKVVDEGRFVSYAHDCRQTISANRWAMVGVSSPEIR